MVKLLIINYIKKQKMKKVILNAPILDLNNQAVTAPTGRAMVTEQGQQQEIAPIKFGKLAVDAIVRASTRTDEEALQAFDLAAKINESLKLSEPTQLELSDEEFEMVSKAIARREVIVKARFLQMVETLNPAE
jgi:hypothetical protein